jgi:putative hemolysin
VGTLQLLACAILIFLSGCISASEIALFSLSRFQLRALKERVRSLTHRRMRRLLQDPGGLLISLLVVNEVINISLSTVIAQAVAQTTQQFWSDSTHWVIDLLLGIAITTPILLLFCEITPKAIGARANQLVAPLTVGPLTFIYDAFRPLRAILSWIIALLSRVSPAGAPGERGKGPEAAILKEAEFLELVEEGHKEGAIHQNEVDLIKNVFELDDTRAEDVLTPMAQVSTLPADTTYRQALAAMRTTRYSRIPIIDQDGSGGGVRRTIAGILYTKDLLKAKLEPALLDTPIRDIIRKPPIAGPHMQLNALFRKLKDQRSHMAVVQRPGGEILGIVTMSDVLDSLFEDLFDDGDGDGGPSKSPLLRSADPPAPTGKSEP